MQAETPIFSATLTPHRALGLRGQAILVAVVVVLASIPGIVFFSLGAWPIVGFLGLDVLAIAWAVYAFRRDGRKRERILLYPDRLEIVAITPSGREALTTFDPARARLIVDRDYEERTTGLRLRADGEEVEIGAFLNPAEKSSFAKAFGSALRRARGEAANPTPRPPVAGRSRRP